MSTTMQPLDTISLSNSRSSCARGATTIRRADALTVRAFRLSPGLKVASGLFLVVWSVIAAFPLVWTALMSFRLPLDALSSDPMAVILGPVTLARAGGVSVVDLVVQVEKKTFAEEVR